MEPPKFQDQALVMLTVANKTQDRRFPTRGITLSNQAAIPIGRQSRRRRGLEAGPNNFFFDCPVMSRDHASITMDIAKQEILIKDSGSLHGTFVNSLRLQKREARRLWTGDVITFGANIDRGTEKFYPYEVEATIAFGSERREDPPTVFRVPDESDVEDLSSSEGEIGTGFAQKVLRENSIRPGPQLPPLSSLDLTPVVDTEPYPNGESILLPIDLTSNDPEVYEISDSAPTRLSDNPETISFSTENNPDGEDYMEWDNEEDLDDEFPYDSEPSDMESPMDHELGMEEHRSFLSDEELSSVDGSPLEEEHDTTMPKNDTAITDTTTTIPIPLMEDLPLTGVMTEESAPLPLDTTRDVNEEELAATAPLNLILQQEPTHGALGASQDETISFVSSEQSENTPGLLLQTSTDQASGVFGHSTDKAEFFHAREENKKKFTAEANTQHEQTAMNVPDQLAVSMDTVEKELLTLPTMGIDEGSHENWQQFSPLEVSGRNFLNSPLATSELPVASEPGVIDDTSAYTFEISKKADQPQAVPSQMINKTQTTEVVVEKTQESPNSLKRKAAQISEATVEEVSNDIRTTARAEKAIKSPKRLRRAAEVVGYVALGGIAVMSALIATAPAL